MSLELKVQILGNEDGELVILKAGKDYEELNIVGYPAPIYATPVIANNTLYVRAEARSDLAARLQDAPPFQVRGRTF